MFSDDLSPRLLRDFIGQEQIKDRLITMAEAAKHSGDILDHLLFYGPEGVGKKTLAGCLAAYMHSPLRLLTASAVANHFDLIAILSNMNAGEVLVIDNIHQLRSSPTEVLYKAMYDFHMDVVIGKGVSARPMRLQLPPFTIIGIAPGLHELPSSMPLHFGERFFLDYYTQEALQAIVMRSASSLGIPIDAASTEVIAKLGRGLPLRANRVLKRVRDYAQMKGDGRITLPLVQAAFAGELPAADTKVQSSQASSEPTNSSNANDGQPYNPRGMGSTPTLEQFGRDMTREAQEGKLLPMVGRETETQLVVETLCRSTKRNPILIGPPGVGKTAIVEGLARLIVAGNVPDMLRGSRLLSIQPSNLVAGTGFRGDFEQRMEAVIQEASQDGILLFLDEVHSMIGAGGSTGTSDVASLLKPTLARGDIACIAATTEDEYRLYIEPDGALERRFQPLHVHELSVEQTLHVLSSLRDELAKSRHVQVSDEVLRWLVEFADQFLPNRYFPDKGVDLLDQCVAHALAQGKSEVDLETAEAVAQRLIGMPAALPERLESLEHALQERQLLIPEDVSALVSQLSVAMRGLDISPSRPNAVLLLTSAAVANGKQLSEVMAESLFGSVDRVVTIDFAPMTQSHDITMLIGAPPGYVGYSNALPIHVLAQTPWSVLLCENVHAAHPAVVNILVEALATGVITDAQGKRIYLRDSLVILTAPIEVMSAQDYSNSKMQEVAPVAPATLDAFKLAEGSLGSSLVAQCDLVCYRSPDGADSLRKWIKQRLLVDLTERYRENGVRIQWDDTIVEWLISGASPMTRREVESKVDKAISPAIVRYLPARPGETRTITVSYRDEIVIDTD